MSHFKSELGKVHYKEIGKGDELLLMFHGNTHTSEIFKSHTKYFQDKYRIILPDLPGHGLSERLKKLPKDYYQKCAEIFLNFLKEKKEKKVNIIGVDGGSIIAMIMASMNDSVIKSVVANTFPGKKISNGKLDLIIEETKRKKKSFFERYRWKRLHGKDWYKIVDQYLEFLENLKYSDERVVVPKIKKIKSRVLLTGSSNDSMAPRLRPIYRKLHKRYPHFNVLLYYSGKYPERLTKKKKFREEILEFLKTG